LRECVVVGSTRNGFGLFAARSYRPSETIMPIAGRVVDYRVLWKRGGRFMADCIRYGPETYLDPGHGPARFVNHSCQPNAGITKIANRLFLFAATSIPARAEILFDYSTTIGDDDIWTMRCNCGEHTCRRTIRRFGTLPAPLRERYLREGLVPEYIVRTLEDRGRHVGSRHTR
jgi:SET domain-containing protein